MTRVEGLSAVGSLDAGGHGTCAVLADHTVRCWGRTDEGQLAIPGGADLLVPTPVPGLRDVASVSLGAPIYVPAARGLVSHGCAVLRSGGAVCWNADGMELQPMRFDSVSMELVP